MVEPLVYESAPIGETVGPFTYVIPADFNRKRLAALSIDDTSLFVAADGTAYAEPSLLCGQHSWVMRRRFSWGGSVHAKCDIAFLKPVRLGSTIHVTGRISGKYERRGGRYVVFELLTTDANGDPVCRVDNAMLLNFREVASARRSVAGATSAAPAPTPDDTEARPALVQRFGSKALRRDDIIAFYQAEEDIYGAHPSLHNDASLARAAGLADIIAPGRYSIALANCLFARVHGPGWLLGARYSVSFMGNLLPGTRADIRATARGVVGAAGGMARQFDLQCDDRASGRVLLSGTVRFSDGH